MKYLVIALLLVGAISAGAQGLTTTETIVHPRAIELQISHNKTTLIVFSTSVKRGDVGQEGVSAEIVKGTNNILRVKADQKFFEPTNLNVITADGNVHVFNVVYSESAPCLPIYIKPSQLNSPAIFSDEVMNENEIDEISKSIYDLPLEKLNRKCKKYGMQLSLRGVFVKGDFLFLKFQLHNNTKLEYDFESFRFFVRDKIVAKRTAVQDTEVKPVFVRSFGQVENSNGQTLIVALPKFSIAENKIFAAEMMEKKGDRNLKLQFGQRTLLRAKLFK